MSLEGIIIIALIAAEIVITIYGNPKDWFKPDLRCEAVGCGKVARLYRTKDKKYLYCHKCKVIYNKESNERNRVVEG